MSLYETDFFLWTQEQAKRLRDLSRSNTLDIENLAEEIEDMGLSKLHRVESLLIQMLVHLIEMASEPEADSYRHWSIEVSAFQTSARRIMTPGMRQRIDLESLWRNAHRLAVRRLSVYDRSATAPAQCPLALEQLLVPDLDPHEIANRLRRTVEH